MQNRTLKRYISCEEFKLLPFISDQKYNVAIKEIFRTVGIDRMVTVENHTLKPSME